MTAKCFKGLCEVKLKMSIYKITNSENDFVYVGKSESSLDIRLRRHELDYGGWLYRGCRKYYLSSFELFRFNDYKIELVETVDEGDLSCREVYHINAIPCINIVHNHNVSTPTFLCPCGETVPTTIRWKHNKSSIHRKSLRELHLKSSSRQKFIDIYKASINKVVHEYIPGRTIDIHW